MKLCDDNSILDRCDDCENLGQNLKNGSPCRPAMVFNFLVNLTNKIQRLSLQGDNQPGLLLVSATCRISKMRGKLFTFAFHFHLNYPLLLKLWQADQFGTVVVAGSSPHTSSLCIVLSNWMETVVRTIWLIFPFRQSSIYA